jgi:hypothetical protein
MTSPACTELEIVVLDWLARALQLPPHFLSENKGGGVIHVLTLFNQLKFKQYKAKK